MNCDNQHREEKHIDMLQSLGRLHEVKCNLESLKNKICGNPSPVDEKPVVGANPCLADSFSIMYDEVIDISNSMADTLNEIRELLF